MTTPRIALVTGGSRGLGRDMAINLAKNGMDVVLTWHSQQAEAEATVATIQALGRQAVALQLDVAKIADMDAFVALLSATLQSRWQTSEFDALINNAGMGATIPFQQITENQFDEFLNVHFKSVFFLTQKCLPFLRDGASIVNVSSGTTRFSIPGYSAYASAKGAVEVFTKYLAKELGGRGIRANVVAPGPIETDFNGAAIRNNPQMKSFLGTLSPLGRVGEATDIGGVVAFLCSAQASWINGQRIEVSGGING
ncbi:MAG: SDR family oxidoreductase [Bacteroidetes bacterium]|nr:MAG: SDR family oxidoreductase [Bacteroidota bacterium]